MIRHRPPPAEPGVLLGAATPGSPGQVGPLSFQRRLLGRQGGRPGVQRLHPGRQPVGSDGRGLSACGQPRPDLAQPFLLGLMADHRPPEGVRLRATGSGLHLQAAAFRLDVMPGLLVATVHSLRSLQATSRRASVFGPHQRSLGAIELVDRAKRRADRPAAVARRSGRPTPG